MLSLFPQTQRAAVLPSSPLQLPGEQRGQRHSDSPDFTMQVTHYSIPHNISLWISMCCHRVFIWHTSLLGTFSAHLVSDGLGFLWWIGIIWCSACLLWSGKHYWTCEVVLLFTLCREHVVQDCLVCVLCVAPMVLLNGVSLWLWVCSSDHILVYVPHSLVWI